MWWISGYLAGEKCALLVPHFCPGIHHWASTIHHRNTGGIVATWKLKGKAVAL